MDMVSQVVMGQQYSHLTAKERDLIGMMTAEGKTEREIARYLNRNPSTISRELLRNGCLEDFQNYLPHQAQEQAVIRNRESHRRKRLKDERIRRYVRYKLLMKWSPELIAGRLQLKEPDLKISHEAIYQWIYKDAPEYRDCLVRGRRRRMPRRYSSKRKKHHIPCRVGIEDRPLEVEGREEAGHWEVDTVGADNYDSTLHVMTERKTRYSLVTKLEKNSAIDVRSAMIHRLATTPRFLTKTFTYDNGPENCGHILVNTKLGSRSYFCRPYHSWERGTVENTIGLIRRFFPKKTKFDNVSYEEVKKVEEWLNRRPRKCLDFKTPLEVYREQCCT